MIKFLLGVVVGAAGMSSYLNRKRYAAGTGTKGRVDELSSAAANIVADPPVNAGDGTPGRSRGMAMV